MTYNLERSEGDDKFPNGGEQHEKTSDAKAREDSIREKSNYG